MRIMEIFNDIIVDHTNFIITTYPFFFIYDNEIMYNKWYKCLFIELYKKEWTAKY